MIRARVLFAVAAAAAVVVSTIVACSNAVATDACQSIEHARCKWIVQCNADASNYGLPTPRSGSTLTSTPVDDCMRYYDDACLHGMVTNVPPSTVDVTACVDAINAATDCTIVANPGASDACKFLTYDAGLDADAD